MTLLWLFSAPCRARHRSSLCSRPFSPAEVGIAKTDCQTVVVFALSILSGFTGLPCLLDEWNEMILKYPHVSVCSRRGMCSALRQMLSGSVCVAIKTWTCMTECTSKLKIWTPSFPVLFLVYSCSSFSLFAPLIRLHTVSISSSKSVFLLLVVNLSVFGWNGCWLDGDDDGNDRWPSPTDEIACLPSSDLNWTSLYIYIYIYIEAVLAGTSLIGALSLLALLSCFYTHLGGRVQ